MARKHIGDQLRDNTGFPLLRRSGGMAGPYCEFFVRRRPTRPE
jgi:hypothetical protein